jgi:SAM-dependent methyltransferase
VKRRVYGRSADYYDALYEHVDYAGDVKFLLDAFKKHGAGKPKRVLDIGSGTGNHAILLAKAGVKVDGVDVSDPLLEIAQRKVKDASLESKVTLHHMDMTRELPAGKFDGAISMFGAWCYARTDEESSKMLSMLSTRLAKGALFVFEFWSPLGWHPRKNWDDADLPDGTRVVRLHNPSLALKDDVYEAEFEHLVVKDGRLIENFSEVHGLRLRTPYQTEALLLRNGFEVAAFTKGPLQGKTWEAPGPNEFRVMAVARKK